MIKNLTYFAFKLFSYCSRKTPKKLFTKQNSNLVQFEIKINFLIATIVLLFAFKIYSSLQQVTAKCVLVGDVSVGKTTLLATYTLGD